MDCSTINVKLAQTAPQQKFIDKTLCYQNKKKKNQT